MINLTSPVTGIAVTGLTSPTYTVVQDQPPDANVSKRWLVTAAGGTQPGVTTHSISSPFSITFWRPKVLRLLGLANSAGVIASVPKNTYKQVGIKGVTPAANQQPATAVLRIEMDIPAGAETYDAVNIAAWLSANFGAFNQQVTGIQDSFKTGTI